MLMDFFNSSEMAAALKFCFEKNPDNFLGCFKIKNAGAQCENIGIIVRPGQLSQKNRVAVSGAHTFKPIGHHGHAGTGTTD